MTAYYNEIEPYAAAWLRNLIAAGLIAPGEVDERSIEDVRPSDLAGFTQCHFFAGIGVWSLALRRAGWPDDRPVWTGSCPCQPFSSAGKGGGFGDERHLWPAFFHLIGECRPDVVFGEQVASKDGLAWLELVQADLEGTNYAVGAVDTCAAGFGAPHIRQRLYWSAVSVEHPASDGRIAWRPEPSGRSTIGGCGAGGLADDHGVGREVLGEPGLRRAAVHDADRRGEHDRLGNAHGEQQGPLGGIQQGPGAEPVGGSEACRLADAVHSRPQGCDGKHVDPSGWKEEARHPRSLRAPSGLADADREQHDGRRIGKQGWRPEYSDGGSTGFVEPIERPGPTDGLWRDPDWLFCRDGKWRPVESGTFPLAHGAPARAGRLRAYGNAITLGQSRAFVEAYLETERVRLTGDVFA